ncbi:MAG: sensor histidine kinase [Cyclobacteriaceae bacterium]|nr:sensor histidine kinase [Cyclobacteriaceae bacterium]
MRRYIKFISVLLFLAVSFHYPCQAAYSEKVDDLLQLVNNQKDNTEKVETLLALAQEFRKIDLDSALMFCDKAYTLSLALDYKQGRADALYKKSLIHGDKGELKDALAAGSKCLYLCDSLQDSMRIAKANNIMGNLKRESSNNKGALGYYRAALDIYLPIKDTMRMIAVYNSIGNYFQDIAAYDSAVIYYYKAYTFSELINREDYMGIILNNLGKVHRLLNYFENSHKYLDLSVKINAKYSEKHLANAYTELGVLAFDENMLSKAMDYINLADSIYRKLNDKTGIHHCHINIAAIYREQEIYNKALINLKIALKYYREQDYAEGMIAAWQGLADVYSKIGDIETALIYNDSCLNLAIQINDLLRQKQTLTDVFEIHYNKGDYEKAILTNLRLREVEDSIYNLKSTEIINELDRKYDDKKGDLLVRVSMDNIRQKNKRLIYGFIYTVFAVVVLAAYLIIFFRYRAKKNQIIAEQKIIQLEEEKKLLAARFLVEGQENERKRIATAIHDSLGVLLSTSKLHLSAIKVSNEENKILIEKATRYLDEASGEMRKISHNMMPGLLSKLGLCEALEDLFETLNEMDGIDARMEVIGPKKRLPENKEIMIYRVAQEMVNNNIKHANADKIDLTLIVHPDQLDVSYSDNGKGFIVAEVLAQKSMGVQSIRSRVKFLDGIINIDSSPGNGTIYRINVPLDTEPPLTSV